MKKLALVLAIAFWPWAVILVDQVAAGQEPVKSGAKSVECRSDKCAAIGLVNELVRVESDRFNALAKLHNSFLEDPPTGMTISVSRLTALDELDAAGKKAEKIVEQLRKLESEN